MRFASRLTTPLLFLAVLSSICGTTLHAESQMLLNQINESVKGRKALIVQIGIDDGMLAIAVAKQGQHVIHAIDPDAKRISVAKSNLIKSQAFGRAFLEQLPIQPLPHVSNLANVVIVKDLNRLISAGLQAKEILRILGSTGTGIIGQAKESEGKLTQSELQQWLTAGGIRDAKIRQEQGLWATFTKPRPADMDEWSHKWHDATRNSASQDHRIKGLNTLQWIGSDPYTWQMRHGRTAGGRVVLMYDHGAGMSRWRTYRAPGITYEVFDAYSGILQWKRKYETGLELGFKPVLLADRIITPLGKELVALDANNGDVMLKYEAAGEVLGGVVSENVLIVMEAQNVKALDALSGKLLWTHTSEVPYIKRRVRRRTSLQSGMEDYCIVAADGRVFIFERTKKTKTAPSTQQFFGLDLKSGKKTWSFDANEIGEVYSRHWYYEGRLMISTSKGLYGLPVDSKLKDVLHIPVTKFNKKTWEVAGHTLNKSYRHYFGVNGKVWTRSGSQAAMLFTADANPERPTAAKTWVGYDIVTGKEVKRLGYEIDGGWQQRCFPDQATPSFILSSNNEIVDLKTGSISNYRALRGMCGEGPFYGNGMYYVPTHYCIFCYPMVRGTVAISSEIPPATPILDEQRLEKGPAFVASAAVQNAMPNEWPAYRGNAKRSAGSLGSVAWPVAEKPTWEVDFGERVAQPVIKDGRAYITVVNQGRIVALDASTGKEQWSFLAGTRIDTPPTLHGHQVLFGCHDGYVYALRASDGALAWRFCAAPERRRMVTCDRVESSWPVMGSVLIADGVLYALAGRITRSDGGMHMYALDPVNGKMHWHQAMKGTKDPQLATGIKCWKEVEGQMMNSLLLKDGNELRLPDQHQIWQFDARTGERMARKEPKLKPTNDPKKQPKLDYMQWYSEGFPWLAWDRPTVGWLMHGLDPNAELRHPYEAGIPSCYPSSNRQGLIIKRIRKSKEGPFSVLIPTKAKDVSEAWKEEKAAMPLAWKPQRLMASENPLSDIYAPIAVGETAFLACTSFTPPQTEGVLRAVSLQDGKALPSVKLPGTPSYDGMSAAYGKLYLALRDGRVVCMAKP